MVVVNPTAAEPTAVDPVPSQAGRQVIVTGANTGLGFQTALAFAGAGAEVVLAVRNVARGEAAAERIRQRVPSAALRVSEIDLADLRSVRSFTNREGRVGMPDVLVANAGVMLVPARQFTADGFEMHMGVNHIGHAALILGLLPAMSEGSAGRIVVVGSTAHWFTRGLDDDLGTTGRYTPMGAYANSKLAGTLFMRELDRRLAPSGSKVRVVGAHPGWCATEVVERDDHPGSMVRLSRWFTQALGSSPPQGARPLIAAASDPDLTGGSYLGPRWALRGAAHQAHLSPAARNRESARRLFDRTLELTGSPFHPA
jgi:NAD(P)-dependent dehydrogenase (short-subunit alcohol dehydrogenase family)